MSLYIPSQQRFLVGAVLGTVAGSLFLVPLGPALFQIVILSWWDYLKPALLAAPFMLCLLLSAGWPLFLAFRARGGLRSGQVGLAGGAAGALVALMLPFEPRWLVACCLAGAGVVAASVCWRFVYWPAHHAGG